MRVGARLENGYPLESFDFAEGGIDSQLVSAGWDQVHSEAGQGQIWVKKSSAITFLLHPQFTTTTI